MCFFFQALERTHANFRNLFRPSTNEDEQDTKRSANRLGKRYGWYKTIKDVSEQLNENWDATAERNLIDFLSKLEYLLIENEVKAEEMERERIKNEIRHGK